MSGSAFAARKGATTDAGTAETVPEPLRAYLRESGAFSSIQISS